MSDENVVWWVMAAVAAAAWVRVAEHPTARNLRKAIADTLGL
jgi:hypothetical protein